MRKFLCILAMIAAFGLTACGQVGPLHLPEQLPPKTDPDTGVDVQPFDLPEQPRQP